MLFERDIRKIKSQGAGFLVAVAIAVAFFCKWMDFMRAIWPSFMQLKTDYNLDEIPHIVCFSIP